MANIVMVVGGPNAKRFPSQRHTWVFYQVEGNIHPKVLDEGQIKRIDINEGDIYLLPSNIPIHRKEAPNTVGLVVEQLRPGNMGGRPGLVLWKL